MWDDTAAELAERTADADLELLASLGLDPARASVIARFVLFSAAMLVNNQPGAEIANVDERAEVQRRKKIALVLAGVQHQAAAPAG